MTLVTPDTHVPAEIKAHFRERVGDTEASKKLRDNLFTHICELYNPEETDEYKGKALAGIVSAAETIFDNRDDKSLTDDQLKDIFLTPLVDTVKNKNSSDTLKTSIIKSIDTIYRCRRHSRQERPEFFVSSITYAYSKVFDIEDLSDDLKTVALKNFNRFSDEPNVRRKDADKYYNDLIKLRFASRTLKNPEAPLELKRIVAGLTFSGLPNSAMPLFLDQYIPLLITFAAPPKKEDVDHQVQLNAVYGLDNHLNFSDVREKYTHQTTDIFTTIASNKENSIELRFAALTALRGVSDANLLKNILLEEKPQEETWKPNTPTHTELKIATINKAMEILKSKEHIGHLSELLMTGLKYESQSTYETHEIQNRAHTKSFEFLNPDHFDTALIKADFIENLGLLEVSHDPKEADHRIKTLQKWTSSHKEDRKEPDLLIHKIDARYSEMWENKLPITGPVSPLVEIDFLFRARQALTQE